MESNFSKYANQLDLVNGNAQAPELLIESSQALEVFYAPFDHINLNAKVVLVGLTPGNHQASVAITVAAAALAKGLDHKVASELAKKSASFSGPMRNNLVRLLNYFGLQNWLEISDCADLFTERSDLVHYTSALRYPVFKAGKNYSGNPKILGTPILKSIVETHLAYEIGCLRDAIFIPLGKPSAEALYYLAERGLVQPERILDGIPHPSGANAERIAYMLEEKPRGELSIKTNANRIDEARAKVKRQMKFLTQ